jgi:hypothetical protein
VFDDGGHACFLNSNIFNGRVTTTNVSTHDVAAGYAIVGDVEFTLSSAADANLFSVTSIGTFDGVNTSTGSLEGSLGASSSGGLVADCNTDCGGSAVPDSCDDCVGGNTGLEACVADCAGVFEGEEGYGHVEDACGVCDDYGDSNGVAPDFPYGTCDCEDTPGGTVAVDCAGVPSQSQVPYGKSGATPLESP